MARTGPKRVQVRLSKEMGSQVEQLAKRLGVSESSLCAVLIAAGFAKISETLTSPATLHAAVDAIQEARKASDA